MDHRPIKPRDDALDALRGLAIFGMVLVNLQGDDRVALPLFVHAEWNGLTLADLVFPLFLLAVGLALPLSLDGRIPRVGIARIVRRSVLLWLVGFAIGWIVHASFRLADVRFTGVLERIAIVYLVCAVTARATRTWRVPAIAAAALMLVHGVLLLTPPPDGGVASMAPGWGFSGWLDRAILGGTRMYGKVFDPEGPLSTLSAIATTMIGIAVMRRARRVRQPLVILFASAAMCAGLAIAAAWFWPLNKALWTPTFTLANAAIGLAMLGLLKLGWARIGRWAPTRLAAGLGQVALTLYIVHALLTAVLVIRIGSERIWASSFAALGRILPAHHLGRTVAHALREVLLADDRRLGIAAIGQREALDLVGEAAQLGRVVEAALQGCHRGVHL